MSHTTLAPTAERMKATCVMLKRAKNKIAYGRKQRRMMNSVCRPRYKKGFDRRLAACVCQICQQLFGTSRGQPMPLKSCNEEADNRPEEK